MAEIGKAVDRWQQARETGRYRPLHIGIFCKRGRHRSFGDALLAAVAPRRVGYRVYTEAPDTKCCGCPEGCSKYWQSLEPGHREEIVRGWNLDGELAADMAARSSAIRHVHYSAMPVV